MISRMRIPTTPMLWLAVIVMLMAFVLSEPEDPTFFYLDDDVVGEYISEEGVEQNFFMNEAGPKVVEFYSPLCPACNEFKPRFIHLAKATRERYPSIKFYGVSCDKYQQVCDEYNVEDFPTLRLFLEEDDPNGFKGRTLKSHSKLSPRTLATLLHVEGGKDVSEVQVGRKMDDNREDEDADENDSEKEDIDNFESASKDDDVNDEENDSEDKDSTKMKNILADQIAADYEPEKRHPPKDMSQDEPKSSLSEEDSDDESKDSDEQSPDFVPPPPRGRNPNAGHLLAKNQNNSLNRFSPAMIGKKEEYIRKQKRGFGVRRQNPPKDAVFPVSMDSSTETMRKFTPGTKEFENRNKALADAVRAKMPRRQRNQSQQLQFTKEALPFSKDVLEPKLGSKVVKHIPGVNRLVKMSDEEELILDATLSLVVALETGVSMGLEDHKSRLVMKNWLDLVSVSLPPEWAVHKLIDTLRNRYLYASKNRDNFRQVIKQQNIPRRGWSDSCRTWKIPNGFSCGMWKLLHVVTVGVAEQRGGKNLIDSGMVPSNTKTFSPMEAASTIRDFIDHFFTCKPCREHFVATYDDCDKNRRCDRLAYTDDLDAVSVADWKELPLWLWEVHNDVRVRLLNERAQREFELKGTKKSVTLSDEVKAIFPNIESCIQCFNEDGTWNEGQVFRYLERVYWPGSSVDPMHDKLLKFENDNSRSFGVLWLATLLIIWFVYSTTGKQSGLIHSSVLAARQMVSQQTNRLGLRGRKLSEKE
ncbi:Erv1 / Alr family protein [Nitzschia inconspicua]|uniref:Erv1 / Alr family protein n=1 Tax=Nitzschia inconspicua TaxID=303405 RepID=A0A9K3LRI7_9STRA|nr:Erv1 / Alr family protein [Nitzschia inconspicua]